ncbi:MAG TPA: hypothetical protein VF591_14470 [Pyrinomonadaceae bacterium]
MRFLLNLQRLLGEGNFVATYKHALLLSIADVCVEKGDDSGGRLRISTDELAEKFISYYWRQAAPYQPAGRGRADAILKQNTGRQASVIVAVSTTRTRVPRKTHDLLTISGSHPTAAQADQPIMALLYRRPPLCSRHL